MMSNFDSMYSSMTESMTSAALSPENKLPLKRLEPTIQRFTRIALPADLERLSQHKKLIKRYKEQNDWEKLNAEQVNARLTVQQLKANIREVDKARCQIRDEDLPALDARVNPLKEQALESVAGFIMECGLEVLTHDPMDQNCVDVGEQAAVINDEDVEVLADDAAVQSQVRQEDEERLQQRLEETRAVEETWNKLRGDLEDVSSLIQDFAKQVKQQKEMTDRIEENIETTQTNVLQGTKNMIRASKLKNVALPLTGAVVGTAIGGPLGLMIGYKVGAAAAFGGGALGFISARVLRRKADAQADVDSEQLEEEQQRMLDEGNTDRIDR